MITTPITSEDFDDAIAYYMQATNIALSHEQYSSHSACTKYGTSAYIKHKQPMPVTYEFDAHYRNHNGTTVFAYKPIPISPLRRMILEHRGEMLPAADTLLFSVAEYLGAVVTVY